MDESNPLVHVLLFTRGLLHFSSLQLVVAATTTRDKLPKREKMKLKWKMRTQGSGPKVSLYYVFSLSPPLHTCTLCVMISLIR